MTNILIAENIHKAYSAHKALDGVSVEVPQGSIFGLLGPNGAGKTTLIRIITQIIQPDSGQILFDGRPLQPDDTSRMGYLPEERGLYKKMKVGEQLIYLARLKGMNEKEARLRVKSWGERMEITGWWQKNVEDLSKGMQQKVQFIATILHEPKFIILDEPFTGFDPVNANLIKDEIARLKASGATILFSTHRMESVEELCDHIALIDKSKVVLSGEKNEIKRRHKPDRFEVWVKGKVASNDLYTAEQLPHAMDGLDCYLLNTNGKNPGTNQILQSLIAQAEVHRFEEQVPTMNDIFIKTVSKSA